MDISRLNLCIWIPHISIFPTSIPSSEGKSPSFYQVSLVNSSFSPVKIGENSCFSRKKTYIFPIFTVNIPCFPVFFWWPPSPKAAAQRPSEARSSCWRRCVRRRSRAEKASKGQSLTMEISSPNYSHSYLARDYWNSHEIPTIILNRNTIYREYHGNTIGI